MAAEVCAKLTLQAGQITQFKEPFKGGSNGERNMKGLLDSVKLVQRCVNEALTEIIQNENGGDEGVDIDEGEDDNDEEESNGADEPPEKKFRT